MDMHWRDDQIKERTEIMDDSKENFEFECYKKPECNICGSQEFSEDVHVGGKDDYPLFIKGKKNQRNTRVRAKICLNCGTLRFYVENLENLKTHSRENKEQDKGNLLFLGRMVFSYGAIVILGLIIFYAALTFLFEIKPL